MDKHEEEDDPRNGTRWTDSWKAVEAHVGAKDVKLARALYCWLADAGMEEENVPPILSFEDDAWLMRAVCALEPRVPANVGLLIVSVILGRRSLATSMEALTRGVPRTLLDAVAWRGPHLIVAFGFHPGGYGPCASRRGGVPTRAHYERLIHTCNRAPPRQQAASVYEHPLKRRRLTLLANRGAARQRTSGDDAATKPEEYFTVADVLRIICGFYTQPLAPARLGQVLRRIESWYARHVHWCSTFGHEPSMSIEAFAERHVLHTSSTHCTVGDLIAGTLAPHRWLAPPVLSFEGTLPVVRYRIAPSKDKERESSLPPARATNGSGAPPGQTEYVPRVPLWGLYGRLVCRQAEVGQTHTAHVRKPILYVQTLYDVHADC